MMWRSITSLHALQSAGLHLACMHGRFTSLRVARCQLTTVRAGGLTEEEIATFQMKVQAVRLPVLHAARTPYGAAALPYGGVHTWGLAPGTGAHTGLGLGAGSCVGPSR